jgi:biopolymer transport protein ExbB
MVKLCGRGFAVFAGSRARSLFLVLILLGSGQIAVSIVRAQDPDRGSTAAGIGSPRGGGRIGGGSVDADASSAPGSDGQDGTPSSGGESLLGSISRASGPVVVVTIVIAAMSFYLIAVIIWMALNYRTPVALPPDLVRDVQGLLEQSKFNEAYQRLLEDPSFLARVLAAGVRKLPAGMAPAHRALELVNEDATMEMEHRTTYLATVGTLGPMIGLVGTVYGMIMAFRVIAQEGSTPQASQLAAGISTALYATLEGIALSIPAIYFYALFRNRIARLSLEVGMTAEPLLERFAPGVRTSASGPGSPAPQPPSHAHPFAVSAALAAATANVPRPALPPAGAGPTNWEQEN